MFVLDTNTLIYFFKGEGKVAPHMFNYTPNEIGIPAIVLFELEMGIKKSTSPSKRIQQLEEMVSLVNILPFGAREARASAHIRFQLEKVGTTIGPYDILIAGTAMANLSTLVTHNTKEFKRIRHLKVTDWF